jgi:hypothetical protein
MLPANQSETFRFVMYAVTILVTNSLTKLYALVSLKPFFVNTDGSWNYKLVIMQFSDQFVPCHL